MEALTTGLGGGLEGSSNLRVHVDGEASLDQHLLIPSLDLHLHPVGEDVLKDGVDDVANPLLWHLEDLLSVRQVIVNPSMKISERSYITDGEALVGRDGNVPDLVPVDAFLRTTDQILQEVDRHLIWSMEKKG